MRGKSLAIAATIAAALALPAVASGHPFSTGSTLFSGEVPSISSDFAAAAAQSSVSRAAAPAGNYDLKRFRFLGLSPRTSSTLATANSDIAFQGKRAYQGHFQGFRIIDISSPSRPRSILEFEECNGVFGQGDVVVYGDILTRSWDNPASAGLTCDGKPVAQGFEGIHVFDISNPRDPELVAEVPLNCGSHTATGVPDPKNRRLYIYSTPSSGACQGIQPVEIPLRSPEDARALPFETAGGGVNCHDTGVILGKVLRAACAGGVGIAVWTMDPREGGSLADPHLQRVQTIQTPPPDGNPGDFRTGHSAAWSNDGETLIIGHEPGGGTRPRCQATGTVFAGQTGYPNNDGYVVQTNDMKSLFFLDADTGELLAKWVLPRDQSRFENCTVHNYNVVPTKNRDVLVSGSYQSGISVIDFSDLRRIREVGYADPAPLNPEAFTTGGDWSSHWYNGVVYQSDITRGFASWQYLGGEFGGAKRLDRLNPQTQEYTTTSKRGRGHDWDD
jgi:hypothetical protein